MFYGCVVMFIDTMDVLWSCSGYNIRSHLGHWVPSAFPLSLLSYHPNIRIQAVNHVICSLNNIGSRSLRR